MRDNERNVFKIQLRDNIKLDVALLRVPSAYGISGRGPPKYKLLGENLSILSIDRLGLYWY